MSSNDRDDGDEDVSQIQLRFFDIVEEPRRMLPPIQGFQDKPLVTLEEAVEPLVGRVHEIEHYASQAKAHYKSPPADGLSIDESASIRLFTMAWQPKDQCLYIALNKTLRSENRELLKDWFLYLKLIISALLKLPSLSCHLFRGVKLDFSQQYPKGDKPVWWGFSSCTDSVDVLERKDFLGKTGSRTLFEIDCYSCRDIRQHSKYTKEIELLLLPATQFEILACLDVGNDLHIVQLKEIEPVFPLIEKGPVVNQVKPAPWLPVKSSQIISAIFSDDSTSRNVEVERAIARVQPCSTVNLDRQQLTDREMKTIVEQAVIEKRCKKLVIQSSKITSQGITTLFSGMSQSTTLDELDLSNDYLSDDDMIPLAEALSVNRTTSVEQWRCCGMTKMKVNKLYQTSFQSPDIFLLIHLQNKRCLKLPLPTICAYT